MQTINFSPLEFENFRQQEAEARRRQYGSFSDMFKGIGDTAEKVGTAQQRYDDAKKAEEWRQKQWNRQRWQEEDERKRREEQERLNNESADRLRSEFMGKYGNMDISGYGLPAQFAMDRIRNARTWEEVVGGGNALAQAIQYQEMLRGQMSDKEAQRAEAAEAEAGERFLGDFNRRAALSGYTPETIGTKYGRIKGSNKNALRQARQAGFEELSGYADELRQYLSDPSVVNRLPPQTLEQLNRRLMAYDEAVSRWSSWMQPRKTTRF